MKTSIIFCCLSFCLLARAEATSCEPIAAPLTFQKLSEKLEKCKLQRIEELLPLLPADFRSRYVLVYASRSFQGATPQFPRVILFGLDAKCILAFAGNSALAGYEMLEIIEFDDQSKKFLFREVRFPADESPQESVRVRQPPVISEVSPPKCMACHREQLRPNWDNYGAWPGVYGSRDDLMPAREKENYQKFKNEIFMKYGRYRFFEDAEKYPDTTGLYDSYEWKRPNLQFNSLLSVLNSQANSREIKENRNLHPFRYALLIALTCPDDFNAPDDLAEFIPPEASASFAKSYPAISQEVLQSVELSYADREKRQCLILNSLNGRSPVAESHCQFPRKEIGFTATTGRLRYIMEGAGVPFPKWSLELGSKNFVFFAGPNWYVGGLDLYLWRELLNPTRDRELYEIYQEAWTKRDRFGDLVFQNGTGYLCKQLRKKSIEALRGHALNAKGQR